MWQTVMQSTLDEGAKQFAFNFFNPFLCSIYVRTGLIAVVFGQQYHRDAARLGVAQQVDAVADALWRVAVMAHTIYPAGGADVEACRIDGCRRAASPG